MKMKRLMATMMVVGMTMGFSGMAMAAEPVPPAAEAKVEWSAETQAKIDQSLANREANQALHEQIEGQRATIRRLIDAKKGAIGQDVKASLAQRREALEARREGARAVREQMAEVQVALKEALQQQDQEAAEALKAELQTLKSTAETEFGDMKAEAEELKALIDGLKGRRGGLKEEVKPLFEEARAIHAELAALRDEFEPVRAAIQAAHESQDDAAMSAALDTLLPLQAERHDLLSSLSSVLGQIIEALQ